MRRMLLALAGFVLVFPSSMTADGPLSTSDPYCQGSSCLNIYNVRGGTRCGSSDSVMADFSNSSGSQYLRGYVIFDTPQGKVYSPTSLLKPGQKVEGALGPAYVCHGVGTPTGKANTGADPDQLKYPSQN